MLPLIVHILSILCSFKDALTSSVSTANISLCKLISHHDITASRIAFVSWFKLVYETMLSLLPFSRQHSRFVWNNTVCFCFGLKMITFHFYQIYREILAFTSLTWILCLKRLNQDRHSGHTRAVHTILLSGKDSGCTAVHMDKGSTIHIQSIYQTYEHRKYLLLAVGGEMLSLICCPDGLWPPVRALCENTPPYLTAVTRHGWNSMLYPHTRPRQPLLVWNSVV